MKRHLPFSIPIALSLLASLPAQASEPVAAGADPTKAPARPKYQDVRYDEDWSVTPQLADSDFYDPIKFIPFDKDGDFWIGFGGQHRIRGEVWDDFAFGAPPNNDAVHGLGRARLYADLHLTRYFRLYVEGLSGMSTKRDLPGKVRLIDADRADFTNAFIDLMLPVSEATVTARVGRQELKFGKDRLVSPLDWANTRRTFDAARVIVKAGPVRIDGFHGQLVIVENTELNESSDARTLSGVYATGKFCEGAELDGYWLYDHEDAAIWGNVMGVEDRHTVGLRLGGKLPMGFDYDAEGAYQFGNHASRTIGAGFFSAVAGLSPELPTKPRLEVGFDYASGDADPNDRQVGTASQYFPLGHAYFGFIDAEGRQNVVAGRASISDRPLEDLSLNVDGHLFYRAEGTDSVYSAGAGALPRPLPSDATSVGTEIDVTAKYSLDKHSTVIAGYSRLFPGQYIDESGPSDPIDLGYLMALHNF